MSERNPCRKCTHYECCPVHKLCNSFASREEAYHSRVDEQRSAREYREYREAYYEYAAESCD